VSGRKIAVVLCNLGGPDGPEAVRPFLFNLFSDKRIIGAPGLVRLLLAALLATTRTKAARANYDLIGGRSPILPETEAQARALETALAGEPDSYRVFIAMRYWKPFVRDAAAAVRAWGADLAILLPLYPQFSTTTTASSRDAWAAAYRGPTRTICCYPEAEGLVTAHAEAILDAWRAGGSPPSPRILFSAHGLPQRIVDAGDPYPDHVARTAARIAAKLPPDWESKISYQSRVGPLQWIGPATETCIEEAAAEQRGLIVCPIAFVSEHVETLVELDVEYAALARKLGLPYYLRAQTPGAAEPFIAELADLARKAVAGVERARICSLAATECPLAAGRRT
jgi:ferrochelatase